MLIFSFDKLQCQLLFPFNISLSFLKPGKVEVVTGVNLPMLLKLSEMREGASLHDYAVHIRDYGMKNIYLASEILNKKLAVKSY